MSETQTESSVLQLVACLPHHPMRGMPLLASEAEPQPSVDTTATPTAAASTTSAFGSPPPSSAASTLSTRLEVDFALALTRLIDDARNDPAQLRAVVYQLAREKLRDQIAGQDVRRGVVMTHAFDVAVQRVEAFAQTDDRQNSPQLTAEHTRALRSVAEQLASIAPSLAADRPESAPMRAVSSFSPSISPITAARRPTSSFAAGRPKENRTLLVRFAAVFAVILGAVVAFSLIQGRRDSLQASTTQAVMGAWMSVPERPVDQALAIKSASPVRRASLAPETSPAVPLPAAKDSPVPAGFGVFAMSGSRLFKLEASPLPMPDLTAKFAARGRTSAPQKLPPGPIKFVVHRALDDGLSITTAEVRIVARVARETSFDRNGRPVTAFPENSFVLRNVAYPYRALPVKDSDTMVELRSDDPDQMLVPGRYTLIVNNATYDFTIDGNVTNGAHCVERLTLPTGPLHSECGEALFVQ